MQPPSPNKRKAPAEAHEEQPRRRIKSDGFRTISMVKGGRKLCKAYNDERGCKATNCPSLHLCDVKLSSGKACLSKTHKRNQHAQEAEWGHLPRGLSEPGGSVESHWQVGVSSGYGPLPSRQVRMTLETRRLTSGQHQIAEQLQATRPVTWRGQEDLPQYHCATPVRGTWLVIDLWSGCSGLCVALLTLGVRFFCLAAEKDFAAAGVAQDLFPNIVSVDDVADVFGPMFIPFLKRRGHTLRGIILGGGGPCQGNSSLNTGRKGLRDPRSQQPFHLQCIRQELGELSECEGLEMVEFLENVTSMPPPVQSQYTEWLGSAPILVDASKCGWVQRRRLLWLTVNGIGVSPSCQPPDDW